MLQGTARGLPGVELVTSNAHPGLVAALGATLPAGEITVGSRRGVASRHPAARPAQRGRPD